MHIGSTARRAALGALLVALAGACLATGDDRAAKASAPGYGPFADVARVLRHPRCLNCHPSGDVPRVGDERRGHAMNVQRGQGGMGVPGMRCSACHRPENQELARVPGAPHWRLAPRSMGWEHLDDRELAEALKDRERNGDRSLEQLLEHLREDPLVGWGWEPGVGREPVPLPRDDFVDAFEAWIDAGAPAPEAGVTSSF